VNRKNDVEKPFAGLPPDGREGRDPWPLWGGSSDGSLSAGYTSIKCFEGASAVGAVVGF